MEGEAETRKANKRPHPSTTEGDVPEDPLAAKKAAYRKFFEEHSQKKREKKEVFEKIREENLKRKQLGVVSGDRVKVPAGAGREWTLAIAIPGSVLGAAATPEFRTYICGQVARAAAIFCVDEIIVYNDDVCEEQPEQENEAEDKEETKKKKEQVSSKRDILHMARVLQYLECPPYLRKYFFPVHDDLKYVGLLNPLDAPHHLRREETCWYREGVVLDKEGVKRRNKSFVDVGLKTNALVYEVLDPGLRVTVKFRTLEKMGVPTADPVPYDTPRTQGGLYWGYDVRIASTFSSILTQSPYDDGYDLSIGVESYGQSIHGITIPPFKHAVVVFSGPHSLQKILEKDDKLQVKDPQDLFDHYISSPATGTDFNIRTEEALLATLSALRPKLANANPKAMDPPADV